MCVMSMVTKEMKWQLDCSGPKSFNAHRNSMFLGQFLNVYSTTSPLAPKFLTPDLHIGRRLIHFKLDLAFGAYLERGDNFLRHFTKVQNDLHQKLLLIADTFVGPYRILDIPFNHAPHFSF